MSEQVKLKAFLAAVLDDYKLGAISQQQAVGGITSLVDAIEISDSGKISLMLSEGRKCQRQDSWPFFAIFNVRYWSLMLSAFRHFIITDWRGVFCQHSRFAFFL